MSGHVVSTLESAEQKELNEDTTFACFFLPILGTHVCSWFPHFSQISLGTYSAAMPGICFLGDFPFLQADNHHTYCLDLT